MTSAHPPRAAGPPRAARLAFPAMLTGSAALAFGPWLVRLADVAPVASAFWRLALALVPLGLLAWRFPGPAARIDRRTVALIVVAGAFFAADLALWHLGIGRTTLENSTLMGNAASFILPVWGWTVARQWPGRGALLALGTAAAGIGLLLGRSADVSATHLVGDLLCIGAGVAYAGYFIAIERARAALAPMPLLLLATVAGAAVLLPLALAGGGAFWPHDWTPLVLLALGSQVIGQGLVVFAARYLPPLIVGLTLLVQPIISAAIGATRFGEALGPAELGGMALVALALVLVRLPEPRARVKLAHGREP